MTRTISAVAIVAVGGVLAACPSGAPAPVGPVASSSTPAPIDVTPPAPSTSVTDTAPSGSASTIAVPGKAVKSPIFSGDSCNKDEECAPVAQCHSNACVALANTGSMKPGMLCTMDCRINVLGVGCRSTGPRQPEQELCPTGTAGGEL